MRYLVLLALLALGCDSTGPPDYMDVSGFYTGSIHGEGSGFQLTGTVSTTITQRDGKLTGAMAGTYRLGDGRRHITFSGTVPYEGSVSKGSEDPAVSFSFRSPECGGRVVAYSGTYFGATETLKITGTESLVDPDTCGPLATLTATATMTK